MDERIVWRRAALSSLCIHIGLGICLGSIGWHAMHWEPQTVFELDMNIALPAQSQRDVSFSPPLSSTELATRQAAVKASAGSIQNPVASSAAMFSIASSAAMSSSDKSISDSTSAVTADDKLPMSAMSQPTGLATSSTGGVATTSGTAGSDNLASGGAVAGTGTGEADGDSGSETTAGGEGQQAGNGSGRFDADGFWSAVNQHKVYPPMAIKRGVEGDVTVSVTLDGNGQLLDASIVASSGNSLLEKAALQAVRRATPFPNETGQITTIQVPVQFRLQ